MHRFLPLQPPARSTGGDDAAESDLGEDDAQTAGANVVFNSSDEEEEDDSCFDALVTRTLSDVSDTLAPTELDDDTQPVEDSPVMDSQVLIVEPDSQVLEPDSQVLEPDQPDDDFMGHPLEPVEPFESQLEEASQGSDFLPVDLKKGLDVSSRPVARPLQASKDMIPKEFIDKNGSNVINLDGGDSPDVKGSATEAAIRARRIASLKAKIAQLEAMQVAM